MCCHQLSRREIIQIATASAAAPFAALAASWPQDLWDPAKPFQNSSEPLRVQPLLMYVVPVRKEESSWKSWGGIQSEQAASEEASRIAGELKSLATRAGFSVEILPVAKVSNPEAAASGRDLRADVTILYPATGSGALLRASMGSAGNTILFVRHRSGPVYYWYEALSTRYLGPSGAPQLSVDDVVVDDGDELLWRLRALYGVKNFLGTRIVALGGPWGKYAPEAPDVARSKFNIEIVDVSYEDFAPRIRAALNHPGRVSLAEQWTARYLTLPGTTLDTPRKFVTNAFLLYGVLKDLLSERDARAITVKSCMGTILPMSQTTACLTLSLLNDEGLLAFCESDFVIIPAGILLRHIAGRPVFLHNSTFPHDAIVTCAHCTGPRRMDATRYEPVRLLTHYESEYGAAPKVEMPAGQALTFINPEYATLRWLGMKGTVAGNPFYQICRSQQDVRILGNWRRLLNEVRDSHWVMVYGDYLREIGYAARRIGVTWDSIAES